MPSKVSLTQGLIAGAVVIVLVVLVVTLPIVLIDNNDGSDKSSSEPIDKNSSELIAACDIYCDGPILDAVQMNFEGDGKAFVDMPMKKDPKEVYEAFMTLQVLAGDTELNMTQLEAFLDENFDPPGSDLKTVTAPDFQATPPMLDAIQNETLKEWALALNDIWNELCREPVIEFPERHSYLPAENILVVPGGRFRESYYWDSYWIVQGLIASSMLDTARGVTQNLLNWVEEFGFVPNGGRIYYLTRSQPPVLSDMVRVTHEADPNMDWLEQATATLDKEYEFWMTQGEYGHAVALAGGHVLNRYVTETAMPRPESYKEDVTTAQGFPDPKDLYRNLRAAAESGWDFSSRWMADQENLSTTVISKLVPVDLNSMLHRVEKNLMAFHEELGNTELKNYYADQADNRQAAMDALLWSEEDAMWRDYNFEAKTMSPVIAASNYYPLWSNSLDKTNTTLISNILQSFKNSGLVQEYAILTTTLKTGQQWDNPNAWPPVQDIVIEGLLQLNTTDATETASSLIQGWVRAGLNLWSQHQVMVEKYNAFTGDYGDGGEYDVQLGFGWSNGVILKFLTKHADLLNNLQPGMKLARI